MLLICLVGVGIGNGWMSPADQVEQDKCSFVFNCSLLNFIQGRYANYLHYHGLLDKQQLTKLNGYEKKCI